MKINLRDRRELKKIKLLEIFFLIFFLLKSHRRSERKKNEKRKYNFFTLLISLVTIQMS